MGVLLFLTQGVAFQYYLLDARRNFTIGALIISLGGLLITLLFAFIIFQWAKEKKHLANSIKGAGLTQDYKTLVESAPLGIYEVNGEFLTYANSEFCRITGYSLDELVNKKSIFDLVTPEYKELLKSKIMERIAGKVETTRYVVRGVQKNGTQGWYEIYGSTIINEGGTPILIGRIADVTEKIEQDIQILQEKNLSETIINSLPDIFFISDSDGNLKRWNANFDVFIGKDKQEIKKLSTLENYHLEYQHKIFTARNEASLSGKTNFEVSFKKEVDDYRDFYFIEKPIEIDGEWLRLSLGVDITEKKANEIALQISKEKYKKLFDLAPMIILVWDPLSLELIDLNEKAVEVYEGDSRNDLIGRSILEFVFPMDHSSILKVASLFNDKAPIRKKSTWRNRTKNGELRYMDFTSFKIDFDGQIVILSMGQDITELELERQLLSESRIDIQRLNKNINSLREDERAIISREIHDELGQQLSALKIDLSLMMKNLNQEQDELRSFVFASIIKVDFASKTIRKISSSLRPGVLDDLGLLSALEWQTEEFRKLSGITIKFEINYTEFEIGNELDIVIFRIYQESLTNVLRHANATHVLTSIRKEADLIIISIQDNGIGFNKEKIKEKKTLGLIGMKERASGSNGQLAILTSEDSGTIVTLSLPYFKN